MSKKEKAEDNGYADDRAKAARNTRSPIKIESVSSNYSRHPHP
jgi:hypothetical protein